jgi:chromosome segregation ATPase
VTVPSPVDDIETLFKLPLDAFTSARNALVARLKKDGRDAEAKEAKALKKPSGSAWVVNQLFWRHRDLFDRLIAAGERLRRAHAAGDDARDAANARREVMASLTAIATGLLRDEKHGATRDSMRRVTTTLEALSSYGAAPGAPVAGRLIEDLEPPGFEAMAALLPSGSGNRGAGRGAQIRAPLVAKVSSGGKAAAAAQRDAEDRKRLIASAMKAVREAERALDAARKQAERAAANRATAVARAKEIDAERAEIEKRLARMAKDAEAARAVAEGAAARLDEATAAAESTERALEVARERLRRSVERLEEPAVTGIATRR